MARDEQEVSPGGSAVYRHEAHRGGGPRYVGAADPERIEDIQKHIGHHLDEVVSVHHELVSDQIHLDVALVPPGPGRPFQTLVTMGMSQRPMTLPPEQRQVGASDRTELVVLLPPEWDLTDSRHFWPLATLKTLARIPYEHRTWLGPGHTVTNGDPPAPYADGTALAGALVGPLAEPVRGLGTLRRAAGEQIQFLTVTYVTADEMDFKLKRGDARLVDQLVDAGVYGVVQATRPSVVKKRWFGRRG